MSGDHAERAKAALCEAGRPDLAELVSLNRAGHARFHGTPPYPEDEARLVHRAFRLTHIDAECPTAEDGCHGEYGTEDDFIREGREAGWVLNVRSEP